MSHVGRLWLSSLAGSRSGTPGSRWPACALGAALALAISIDAAPARGDEIREVKLTASGPDSELPLRRSFYLSGTAAADAQAVQVFIVRKGSAFMFGGKGPACADLSARLHVETGSIGTGLQLPAGRHRVHEAFPGADGSLRGDAVMTTATWTRGDRTGEQTYRLLVQGDRDFYLPGYTFCLFVGTVTQKRTVDTGFLRASIDGLVRGIRACQSKDSCPDDAIVAYEKAIGDHVAATSGSGSARAGVDADKAAALRAAARESAGAALDFDAAVSLVRGALADPTRRLVSAADVTAGGDAATPVGQVATPRDHLAAAIALLLWRSFELERADAGFTTPDRKLAVAVLRVGADGKTLQVASGAAARPEATRVLTIAADKLPVTTSVSLADLILVRAGRVVVQGQEQALAEVGRRLSGLALDGAWSAADAAYAMAARARFAALADAAIELDAVRSARVDDGTRAAILAHLAAWLPAADTAAIQRVSQGVNALVTSKAAWDEHRPALTETTVEAASVAITTPLPIEIEYDESTWVFSYVTPVVGYAEVLQDGGFTLLYLGAQVHLWPNPVNDVMWSHGVSDVRRAFALEVGFAPNVSSFGPDHRFTGLDGFPPAFVGLAVHLLPYTSLTFGGALLNRKRTALEHERPHHTFEPYLGLNVQFNLPDLVRQVGHPEVETSVTH